MCQFGLVKKEDSGKHVRRKGIVIFSRSIVEFITLRFHHLETNSYALHKTALNINIKRKRYNCYFNLVFNIVLQ